jgi:hypothetical protein
MSLTNVAQKMLQPACQGRFPWRNENRQKSKRNDKKLTGKGQGLRVNPVTWMWTNEKKTTQETMICWPRL